MPNLPLKPPLHALSSSSPHPYYRHNSFFYMESKGWSQAEHKENYLQITFIRKGLKQ